MVANSDVRKCWKSNELQISWISIKTNGNIFINREGLAHLNYIKSTHTNALVTKNTPAKFEVNLMTVFMLHRGQSDTQTILACRFGNIFYHKGCVTAFLSQLST